MNDDSLDIPAFLRREDTPEEKAGREATKKLTAKASSLPPRGEPVRATLTQHDLDVITELTSGAAATKRAKAKVRIAKLLANKSGATASMPLQGKAALAAIAGEGPPPDTNEARLTQRGVHVKKGKKETALQEARESELSSQELEPTPEAPVGVVEGAAAEAAAEPNKETTVKAKKKASRDNARTPVKKNGHANGEDRATKMRQIADLMRGKHGVTTPEALAIVGWPSVSMPAVAKAAGIKLRKEKDKGEKHTRYFAA